MKTPDLSKWNYSEELEGLLFFAQSLEEMLFDHTMDTYKAPALNLRTNALELSFLSSQLLQNRIRPGAISSVVDELLFRVENDPIIRSKKNSVFTQYAENIHNSASRPQELVNNCDSFLTELDYYWDALIGIIPEIIKDPNKKNEIKDVSAAFITEAEQNGFSRNFLFFKVNSFFFDIEDEPKTINKLNQINDFLSIFQKKKSRWKIIFRGSDSLEKLIKFQDSWKSRLNLTISNNCPEDVLPKDKNRKFLSSQNELKLYLSIELSEDRGVFDPVLAKEIAKANIEIITDMYSYITHEENLKISDSALVINLSENISSLIDSSRDPMTHCIERNKEEEISNLMNLFVEVYSAHHFDYPSTSQFIRSFEFHRAALESNKIENKLVNLWTSLETFLPIPSDETARIISYINAIVSVQTLIYSRKIFENLIDSIQYSNMKIKRIIQDSKIDGSFIDKAIAITVSQEAQGIRDSIFSALDTNPLLKHRIYEVSESFKSKKSIKNTLSFHRTKVIWHVQRIYTLRNEIVHSGIPLPYTSTLVENLHSYIDSLIEATSSIAIFSATKISISGTLGILSAYETNYLKMLEGADEPCTMQNYKDLIFGKNNPISPYNNALSLKCKS